MRSHWKSDFTLIPTTSSKLPLQITTRASKILPALLNKTYLIYNGKKYISITITEKMLNHKIGEFSLTRAIFKFKKKEKKKKK